jgi:hypothetical protein
MRARATGGSDRRLLAVLLGSALLGSALWGLAPGCSGDDAPSRPEARRADPEPGRGGTAETHEVRVADPALPPATLGVLEGSVFLGDATAVTGAPVELGAHVRLEGEGRAVLELPAGARATLHGAGVMSLAEAPDQGLWIASGAVHVADPPAGLGSRAPLRVATPAVTLELQGAADVVVVVDPSGVTTAFVLSGHVEASVGEVDARRRLRTIDVVAGLRVRAADRLEEPSQGVPRLEEALASARELRSGAPTPSPVTPPAPAAAAVATSVPSLGASTHRLDEAMRWLELEQRRGRDLTARHRAAVQAGRSDEAMEYQREIVGHAQAVHALRQVVLTRWERLALTAELRADAQASAQEIVPRRDRLRNLLGS